MASEARLLEALWLPVWASQICPPPLQPSCSKEAQVSLSDVQHGTKAPATAEHALCAVIPGSWRSSLLAGCLLLLVFAPTLSLGSVLPFSPTHFVLSFKTPTLGPRPYQRPLKALEVYLSPAMLH